VLEDMAALVGLFIVLISTTLAKFINPVFDAIGSIFVGALLLYVSIVLMSRIRKFIVGESLPREKRSQIRRIIQDFNDVDHVNHVKSIVMGNNKYLLLVSIDFNDEVKAFQAEDIIEQIKIKIKKNLPEIGTIYIELKDLERNQKI
jgi:divalent metal cation (Fe/Co/Zn/Cd) transporter